MGWYVRRLRTMPLGEIVWRIRSKVTEFGDRCVYRRRREWPRLSHIARHPNPLDILDGSVLGAHLSTTDPLNADVSEVGRSLTLATAEKLLLNRLSIFDLKHHDLGDPINWNYEYKAQKPTPTGFASSIDYRDYQIAGDCKFAWEPSRHHHLVTLGRAYRLTTDPRFARAALDQLDGWIAQCPFGTGMQWRSPLELAIRLINWVWTLELLRPSGLLTGDTLRRVLPAAYRHLWDISRKYSRFSSANNHLIGEAAGVFIGSSYFAGFGEAPRWRSESRAILLREILRQTHADGGNREQAFGYHLFVLQFLLLAGLVARNSGDRLTPEYWSRLEHMFAFAAAFIEGGGAPPMFGDCDDGYVLDLGPRLGDLKTLMSIGAALFDRDDFKALADTHCDAAFWLLGRQRQRRLDRVDANREEAAPPSRALPESGYYILHARRKTESDNVTVTFDCGALGFKSIAAHGHADALSVTLRVGGVDVLVDPGTYDYFSFAAWRDYFRSTAAHNTIVVDDMDQSEMLGPFMWGRRATTKCLDWSPSVQGGVVRGEHDGYQRLSDPVIHRRTLELARDGTELTICDEIEAHGTHDLRLHLHCAEQCSVVSVDAHRLLVDFGCGRVGVDMDPSLSVSVVKGAASPILGWVSRSYHRKAPSPTIVGRCRCAGAIALHTRVVLSESVLESWGERERLRLGEAVCS